MRYFLHRLGFWHLLMVRRLSIVAAAFALAPTAVQAQVNFAGSLDAVGPVETYLATNLNDFPNTATAVDPAGNIYLCNVVTNQLFESLAPGPSGFAPSSFSSYSPIPNPGVCAGPQTPPVLAVDAAGDIFSANATQIQMLPKSQSGFGALTVIGSGFNKPTDIATDNDGNVFVADSGNQQIVEIPKVAKGYGSKVTIFGGENQLIGVAIDGAGNLYAAGGDGSGSGYVVKAVRTATGFDAPTQIASGLNFVNGLAVDAAGDVFVSSNANATPANFKPPSAINLWEIGITASGYAPAIPLNVASSVAQGISTDAQGNVYLHSVVNFFGTNDDQVTVITPNSQPFGSVAVNGNPMHFGSVVSFWVTSPLAEPPTIAVYNRGNPSADFIYGSTNQVFCSQSGAWAQAVYPVQCYILLALDPQYSGDRGAGVLVSNDSGAPLATAYLTGLGVGPQAAFDPGVPSTVASELNPVQGTTVDGLGDVYIASSAGTGGTSNGVVRVPAGADGFGTGSSVGKIPNPLGVSMDNLGNLFVIDGSTFNVYELPWTGTGFGAQQIVVDGRLLTSPSAIAVDPLGNLYLTESSVNRVLVVPWLRTAFGEPQVISTSLHAPTGIAVDGEQNVYVVDQGNNRVVELPWIENHYGSPKTVLSSLVGPTAIAVDGNHNLFVVNESGSQVVQSAWSGTAYIAPTIIYSGAAGSLASVSVDRTDSLYIGVNTKTGTSNGSVIKLDRSVPAPLDFASTPVGKTSVDSPKKVSVQNAGNQPLTFTSLLYPADFSMGVGDPSACTATTTLAQGGRCDLTVQYVPTVPGPVTESVTFNDNTTNLGGGQHSLTVSSAAQSLVPFIFPVSGFYSTPQLLTIVAPVAGAKIYFTQDGSTPTTSSTLYTAPVSIQISQSVNAIAVVNGVAGPVVNAVYSFQLAATEVNFNSGGIDASQLALNRGATVTGGALQLTDGSPAEARSAWFRNLVPVNTFTSDFTFQIQSPVADGFTFAIQDAGLDAVGVDGAGLGYQNIPRSVAVKFDLYNNQGEGNNSTGVFIDGAEPTLYALTIPSTVNLHSGDVMHAHLSYDGAHLTFSLSDTVTGASFETVFPGTIDIPSIVGGNYAWVGFTGGTGGKTAIQNILSWTYSTGGSTGFAAQPPIISPASSLQSAPVTVKIQTTTQNGAIYYTLDGTVPTTASTLYTGPFITNPEQIVNAVTVAPGYATSTVSTVIYSDHTNNGFPGGVGGFIFNGSASAGTGTLIRLTNGGTGERSSAWAPNKLPVQSFSTDFTFHLLDPGGDGFTLTFQNAGQHALGADGAGLGYEGILKSVALKFDLYSNAGEGPNSTGIFTGGAVPTLPALDLTASGIDLHSGHSMHAWVEYDGTVLALTLMDTVTRTTATQTFPVNIPAAVGGSEAWVGFTAGTGKLSAVQSILSWNYEY